MAAQSQYLLSRPFEILDDSRRLVHLVTLFCLSNAIGKYIVQVQ
jgi:hypothetical protein